MPTATRLNPIETIMNADISERGRHFAAQNADLGFTLLEDEEESWAQQIMAHHDLARSPYQREIQVWTHGYVVIDDTEVDARSYLHSYAVERADPEWVQAWVNELGENAPALRPEQLLHMR
jgi:alkanesulfonate monooxygenase SsuD/methylene tetrahydromethanopterin reductase-like flavin-dependent oxidoreductase (luciferase family)